MPPIKNIWALGIVSVLLITHPETAAAADWTVVNLHSSAFSSSMALAVDGSTQGGISLGAGWDRATLWRGTPGSAAVIQPEYSFLYDIAGTDKVGIQHGHATLWQGQGNAVIDLHPAGASSSGAYTLTGNSQGGQVVFPGPFGHRAALWYGTADSFVDLTPPNSEGGVADVDAVVQVGGFTPQGGAVHAALWHGTADSVVDLHPAGAYASSAQAISNGRQGGYVQFERNGPAHAALWSGTPESYIDITPLFVRTAGINGMDGGVQAGVGVRTGSSDFHALVWFGSADSCLDLHSFLSSDYTKSEARAVDIDEFGTIRVVGYAYYNRTLYPHNEAMMWVLVPEPSPFAALLASLAGLAAVRRRR